MNVQPDFNKLAAIKKHFEGFQNSAYQDSGKVWTIGWGFTYHYDKQRKVQKGDFITIETATRWLPIAMKERIDQANLYIKKPLNPDQSAAIVDYIYNRGIGNFLKTQLDELIKGKRKDTLAEYQRKAEKIKPYFTSGEAFKKIEYIGKDFILVGEIDFDEPLIMNDLKISSSHKYWESRNSKEDFLQSIYYNFINHLNGLPTKIFKYIVFAHDTELIKTYIATPEQIEKHYDWINMIVNAIADDLFLTAYPDEDRCLNQTYGVCNYLDYCKEAQEYFNNLVKEVEII